MISQSARIVRRLTVVIFSASLAVACSSQPSSPLQRDRPVSAGKTTAAISANHFGDRAVAAALQQVGVPYRYGGNSPSGFDCSGLVQFSYAHAGKTVPRTTGALWADALPVSDNKLRKGDLLFFSIAGKMSHVGMYIGDGRFVHAPASGKRVSIESLKNEYYRKALIRAGRPD